MAQAVDTLIFDQTTFMKMVRSLPALPVEVRQNEIARICVLPEMRELLINNFVLKLLIGDVYKREKGKHLTRTHRLNFLEFDAKSRNAISLDLLREMYTANNDSGHKILIVNRVGNKMHDLTKDFRNGMQKIARDAVKNTATPT